MTMMPKGISDGGMYHIVPYGSYTAYTPALPQFYWDVYSAEQRIKHICFETDKLAHYASYLAELLGKNNEDIQELRDYVNEFLTSGFDDALAEKIAKWIDDHLQFIFTHTIRQVYFGLTQDGHFVAYVPDSWSDIVFDTGSDINLSTYGRLILRWDADSPNNVDQTPEIIKQYDNDYLKTQIVNIMHTLYSA
jgi:hypothetical protein